jgi:FAD/FMN-containing dehydrogenase
MTLTSTNDVQTLRGTIEGSVIAGDDPGYDEARSVWNADIDRRPALIARCVSAADVASAVGWAREHGVEIAVRGGAHSMSGSSSVDGGLVIDLSAMRSVTVDPVAKRARVGGGALLGDLDAACQAHGLAVPAGMISHTGVGGLTLGGGMGWLTRKAGLTIDSLLSAEIVLADGHIQRTSDQEHPELFWALRGGGGNFGVVTEFEFQLLEVGPIVDFGLFFWSLDQGTQLLRFVKDLMATLPRDLNIVIAALNAPPAPFVPERYHFQPGYALLLTGFGGTEQHASCAARIRAFEPPLFEMVNPMPYLAVQQLLDEPNAWGHFNYEKSTYLTDLSDDAVEVITDYVPRKTSPMSVTLIYRLDEAYCDVAENDTAFGGKRTPRYSVFIIGVAPDKQSLSPDREWARSFWEALQPAARGAGSYVNSMAEYDNDLLRATYGTDKLARLARIKAEYDPDNFFHRNINIKPADSRGTI